MKSRFVWLFALLAVWFAGSQGLRAQITDPNSSHLDIISTDVFEYKEIDGRKVQTLTGNVHLRQDTTDFYCDSAIRYMDTNYVLARSHVRIVFSDSMNIVADRLTYDGETKVCDLYDNIVLTKGKSTLRTPRLTFYRKENYGYYFNGGILENGDNRLTSQTGYFYPDEDMAYFKKNVVLVNPKFTLTTDSMGYQTEEEVAIFLAPTWVKDSNQTSMYTEGGYYDTKNGEAFFYDNAQVGDSTYTLFADTIYYDRNKEFGRAINHIRVVEADTGLTIYGNYGEFFSKTEESFITDSAWAVQIMEKDTLWLFADTLRSQKDSLRDQKIFSAYRKARFFMADMQGRADSLSYLYTDSIIQFFKDPVIWSDENQITGDTIKVFMKKGKVDSIAIPQNAFIIVQEDTIGFNQVKGLRLYAKLDSNKLKRMWVFGNSENIYYAKDDKGNYQGMNRSTSVDMNIWFAGNKPKRISFAGNPKGTFSPLFEVWGKPQELEGFRWRESERPVRPAVQEPEAEKDGVHDEPPPQVPPPDSEK